jgi:hypothetical protein
MITITINNDGWYLTRWRYWLNPLLRFYVYWGLVRCFHFTMRLWMTYWWHAFPQQYWSILWLLSGSCYLASCICELQVAREFLGIRHGWRTTEILTVFLGSRWRIHDIWGWLQETLVRIVKIRVSPFGHTN